VGGWVGGWVGVKAVLRIAYSNQQTLDYTASIFENQLVCFVSFE
jgi:hypothetical protein